MFLSEIGLMTNPTEDALLATDAYQNKLVSGLTSAILCFLTSTRAARTMGAGRRGRVGGGRAGRAA